MKNQRKTAPQRGIEGSWAHRYQCPQKAHHIKEVNSEKCAHCKPLTSDQLLNREVLKEKNVPFAQKDSEYLWAQKYRCAQKLRHIKEANFEKCQKCKPHWYQLFANCYNFVKCKFTSNK